jgi:hypothetical protein
MTQNDTLQWVTLGEGMEVLAISRSTLFRKIKNGEIKSRMEGKKKLVQIPVEVSDETQLTQMREEYIGELRNQIDYLKSQVESHESQNRVLQNELSERNEVITRNQTIIISLTQTLNKIQQQLLDSRNESWWKRLLRIRKKEEIIGII